VAANIEQFAATGWSPNHFEFLSPIVGHQFRLNRQAGADGDGVEVIDRLGTQLDTAVTMPEFLQDGAALGVGPIDMREFVLEKQVKDVLRITPVGLLA
jgi:hypothetical protein